jgi:hypothetical protein
MSKMACSQELWPYAIDKGNQMREFAAILMLGLSACIVHAQQDLCNSTEAQHAEMEAGTVRSWDALHKLYKSYRHCDDGAIAEGFSESVARILVDHWDTLLRLAEITAKAAPFQRFVLLHVDSTLDTNDLKTISRNAKTKCPSELRTICAELKKKADSGISEQAALGIK